MPDESLGLPAPEGSRALLRSGVLRPIAEAVKGGPPVLAVFKDPIPRPDRPDLRLWDGLWLPIRHPGLADDGFDVGWNIAAPVGNGGFPDDWFEGWLPFVELAALLAHVGWRPFETARRRQNEVVWVGNSETGVMALARWDGDAGDWIDDRRGAPLSSLFEADLWHPLPEGPGLSAVPRPAGLLPRSDREFSDG